MVATAPFPSVCSFTSSAGFRVISCTGRASMTTLPVSGVFITTGLGSAGPVVSSCHVGPPSRSSMRWHCLQSPQGLLLRPSAFPCLSPARWWRVYWNSARVSNHLATWSDGSFLLHSHKRDAWSVLSSKCCPYRYGRKCLTPLTTASNSFRVTQ